MHFISAYFTAFFIMKIAILLPLVFITAWTNAQPSFSRIDSLRGTLNSERNWWKTLRYDIEVEPDFVTKSIEGTVTLYFKAVAAGSRMQLDLQAPMKLRSAALQQHQIWQPLSFTQYSDSNVIRIDFPENLRESDYHLKLHFSGTPRAAVHAPWDGGWVWKTDEMQQPWISAAVQGLGASAWFPCKDHPSDEPDSGASLTIKVPPGQEAIANGRLIKKMKDTASGKMLFSWEVKNPINTYNIIPYVGNYTHRRDSFMGEKGVLSLDYYFLKHHANKADTHFLQTKNMLRSMEYWFGPYPFYEDGYKLVEAPYLGMEHQSAIAYGNGFQNGYFGKDLSGSGEGMKFDFIIVHESGHEWFGNSISCNDIADMWIHESFTSFSEVLYLDYHYGKAAANRYCVGVRKLIENKQPMISAYGVHQAPGIDIYYKGENMLQTLRNSVANDSLFREVLRGLGKRFYHKTVNSAEIEDYMIERCGRNYKSFFDQYLRTTAIPELAFYIKRGKLFYRYSNVVPGFYLPIHFSGHQGVITLRPSEDWQFISLPENFSSTAFISQTEDQFYIHVRAVKPN